MSTKQALHTLQARLAERLQLDAEDLNTPYWLAVKVSDVGFLLPLAQSGEIYPWTQPHPVPYAKDWFLGVANLRGSLCGVASLALYMDLAATKDKERQPLQANWQDKRFVAFHPALEMNTVLSVDQLVGLRSIDQLTATDTPHIFEDVSHMPWQEIDLTALAQNPNFVSIEAHK